MTFTESSLTMRARKLQSHLQMLNCHSAVIQVNVRYCDAQSFRDAAAKMRQQPDKESVSEIGSLILKQNHFSRLKICFHSFS
jgi:hypothetical protein